MRLNSPPSGNWSSETAIALRKCGLVEGVINASVFTPQFDRHVYPTTGVLKTKFLSDVHMEIG